MKAEGTPLAEGEHIRHVWLIEGIAHRRFSLQAATMSAETPSRLVRWCEGEPRPVRVPWVVTLTERRAVQAVEETPRVIDMRKHVQWRSVTPAIKVSWMTRNTPAPEHDPALLAFLLPKRISWQHSERRPHHGRWV